MNLKKSIVLIYFFGFLAVPLSSNADSKISIIACDGAGDPSSNKNYEILVDSKDKSLALRSYPKGSKGLTKWWNGEAHTLMLSSLELSRTVWGFRNEVGIAMSDVNSIALKYQKPEKEALIGCRKANEKFYMCSNLQLEDAVVLSRSSEMPGWELSVCSFNESGGSGCHQLSTKCSISENNIKIVQDTLK